MALALDRVAFLELLLNYGVSVQSILNKNLLGFLYGYRALVRTNCSTMKYEENDYLVMNIEEREKVSELWSFNEHEEDKVCIKLEVIQKNINKLCKRFIKKGDYIYSKVILNISKFFYFLLFTLLSFTFHKKNVKDNNVIVIKEIKMCLTVCMTTLLVQKQNDYFVMVAGIHRFTISPFIIYMVLNNLCKISFCYTKRFKKRKTQVNQGNNIRNYFLR